MTGTGPAAAARRVAQAFGISVPAARQVLAQRAAAVMIATFCDRMHGYIPPSLPVQPAPSPYVIWPFFWGTEVARDFESPLWTVGDVEFAWQGRADQVTRFFGVRFADPGLEELLRGATPSGGTNDNDLEQAPAPANGGCLPVRIEPRWNWADALAKLVAIANQPDGLMSIPGFDPPRRGSLAALERWFAVYFASADGQGASPSESECRKHAKAVMARLQR